MDLKERLEIIEGIKLEYDVQGYLSTNDGDYLIETIQKQQEEIKEANEITAHQSRSILRLGDENKRLQEEIEWLYGKLNQIGFIIDQSREEIQ